MLLNVLKPINLIHFCIQSCQLPSKMAPLLNLSLFLLCFLSCTLLASCGIDIFEAKKSNHLDFLVFNNKWINLPNEHSTKSKATLQMSLVDADIESVTLLEQSQMRNVSLSDNSNILISMSSVANSTLTTFSWIINESKVIREVCLHYGHNKALW